MFASIDSLSDQSAIVPLMSACIDSLSHHIQKVDNWKNIMRESVSIHAFIHTFTANVCIYWSVRAFVPCA